MNKRLPIVLSLFVLLGISYNRSALSWNDAVTHKDISRYASEISILGANGSNYLKNFGFMQGFEEYLIWGNSKKQIKEWLTTGSELEDDRGLNIARSKNHFHDPLKPWPEAGLSDLLISGKSAILWGQDGSAQLPTPEGDWSWQRVRNLYYSALISSTPIDRDAYFAQTFKGLGHQMHLLQDMAVPYHVRNDAHPLDAIIGKNGRDSFFETWTKNNIKSLTDLKSVATISIVNSGMPQIVFNTPTDNGVVYSALAPITQLFDTNQYVVGALPSTSNTIGLSEYTNANFFSDDTINMPLVWVSDGHSFPYPNAGSTNLQDYISSNASPTTIIAEDGVADTGFWIQKTGDEPIVHFVKPGYTTNNAYDLVGGGHIYYRTFVLDDECHRDYAEKLLPRAVGYSAALLNYFFRGALEITIPDIQVFGIADGSQTPFVDTYGNQHQQFTKIRAKVKNTTANSEAIGAGILQAIAKYKIIPNYAPDLSNYPPSKETMALDKEYSYSVSATVDVTSISSASFADYTFNFEQSPIPAGITDLTLQVVFKGTIGNEADNAIAVGFRDISEPTHMVFWNLTDRFSYGQPCPGNPGYLCYDLYTEEQINSDTVLKAFLIARGVSYAPETFTMKFAFKGSQPAGLLPTLAQASIPAGGHVRLIVLGDGQSSTVNYVQYAEQYKNFWDVFSSAIVLTVPDGSIAATPTTTFRYHGSPQNPVPFVQHYDYEIIDCYPALADGSCVIDESQEPAVNLPPVTVQIMMP